MSGVAARDAANRLDIPMVHTFHALGVVKRRHQEADDTSPIERRWLEPRVGREADGVVATCSDEAFELTALRSEEHTSELQSRGHLVCRLLLEKKKTNRRVQA